MMSKILFRSSSNPSTPTLLQNADTSIKGAPLASEEIDFNFNSLYTNKAEVAGQVFTGPVSASNLSGTNTGDQDLSGLALKTGSNATGTWPIKNAVTLTDAAADATLPGTAQSTDADLLQQMRNVLKAIQAGGANMNFAAMPQVSGAPIIEAGSNSNGHWIKYADGSLKCWGSIAANLGLDAGIPAISTYSVTFPTALYSTSGAHFAAWLQKVTNGGALDQTGKLYANGFWFEDIPQNTTGAEIWAYPYSGVNLFGTGVFGWRVNGRWKA